MRNKVLKAVLKREQELVAEGPNRAALTEENYVFGETETEPDRQLTSSSPRSGRT